MTWNGIRGTLQWLLLLLLVGVIAAGGIGARLWSAKEHLLSQAVQQKLNDTLPDCISEFASLRMLDLSNLELTELVVRNRQTGVPMLRIPRAVIVLDSEMLTTHRRISVTEVVASSPEIHLLREQDGTWNWSGMTIATTGDATPEWIIKNGTVLMGSASNDAATPRAMVCQGIQANLIPEAHRRFRLEGRAVAEAVGAINLSGALDAESGEWFVQGNANEVRLGDSLLQLAGMISPRVATEIAALRESNEPLRRMAGAREPFRTASSGGETPVRHPLDSSAEAAQQEETLMRGDLGVQFQVGQLSRDGQLDYRVRGRMRNGQISNLLLPVPLYDLEGEVEVTPDKIQISGLKAANQTSFLYVDGEAERADNHWTKNFVVRATQLQLDERIRGFVPAEWIKYLDLIRPSGEFDIDVELTQQPNAPMKLKLQKFAALNCRAECDYFRYPVEKIQGEVKQTGSAFTLQLRGQAAGQPVMVQGILEPGNPERSVDVHVSVTNLPIDDMFRNALRRPEQQAIRETIESLRLRGMVRNFAANILRSRDTAGKVLVRLQGDVQNGSLNFTGFPYDITNASGRITYDPLRQNSWLFENLKGSHGDASITGQGEFDLSLAPAALALKLALIGIPIDHDLRKAVVTANRSLDTLWTDFDLGGRADVARVEVGWRSGAPPKVTLNGIQWQNGHFTPPGFRYAWNQVAGALHWDGAQLRIHSLDGWHGDTYMHIDGARSEAFVNIPSDASAAWRLAIGDLQVRKLNPDDELRRALPQSLRSAMNFINLQNPVDLQLRDLTIQGIGQNMESVTAAWQSETFLRDNQLTAGLELKNLTGKIVVHRGVWDGKSVHAEGALDLQTLQTLEMPFRNVQGPFIMKGAQISLGAYQRNNERSIRPGGSNPNQPLRSELYGGQVDLDLDVAIDPEATILPYRLELNVWDVDLAQWAADSKINYQRLMGKVNANLKADGRGSAPLSTRGKGWIQVMPAALGELPVFAQMSLLSNLRQVGDTAFNYAYGEFDIADGLFKFSKIHLVGKSIGLVGTGTIGYAGPHALQTDLTFFSQASVGGGFLQPIVKVLADRWIKILVMGPISNPIAQLSPNLGPLDSITELMQGMSAGPPRLDRSRQRSGPTAAKP